MALRAASSTPLLQIAQHGLFRSQVGPSIIQRYSETLLRPFAITLPWALSDIWESVLRAVPKKKTTHNKKRHRQMAGKALQDVTALNSCSGCGRVKRAHTICVYCIFDVRKVWKHDLSEARAAKRAKEAEKQEKKAARREARENEPTGSGEPQGSQ
ncbi:putative ribosomal L32p protein [Elsinoe australis]|uniref:Large ribosomal subunit protein bL32m n=1 Tax=Elsinoe australis TaxID=40998 RepID=A0A4U7AXJ5_9PEZI|nr:putative ribosomal L32p protein [Elsinoe australis]